MLWGPPRVVGGTAAARSGRAARRTADRWPGGPAEGADTHVGRAPPGRPPSGTLAADSGRGYGPYRPRPRRVLIRPFSVTPSRAGPGPGPGPRASGPAGSRAGSGGEVTACAGLPVEVPGEPGDEAVGVALGDGALHPGQAQL